MRVEVVGGVILLLVVIIVVAVANRPDPEPEVDPETDNQNTENQNQDQQDQNPADHEIIEENDPLPPSETELPSCTGSWDLSTCSATQKKRYNIDWGTGVNVKDQCREVIPDGTEKDCIMCTGTYGQCEIRGDDPNPQSYFQPDLGAYDYCPDINEDGTPFKKACRLCQAVLETDNSGEPVCNDQGKRTYVWADSDYAYDQLATKEYYCPQEEQDKIGTSVESELCCKTGTIDNFYGSYLQSVDESIKVECSNGKCPVYDFVHFNLDSGRDLVTIYDGEIHDASKIIFQNPLGRAHGVVEENDEAGLGIVGQATNSKMLVRFESDRFDLNNTGWKMNWSCCHECGLTEMPESAVVKK